MLQFFLRNPIKRLSNVTESVLEPPFFRKSDLFIKTDASQIGIDKTTPR